MDAAKESTQVEPHHLNTTTVARKTVPWRRVGINVVVALVFFLLGSVPMWLKAHTYAKQRDAAHRELRLSEMQNTLASAVIDARRGVFEPARQTASDFFTALRNQIDAGDNSTLTATQREDLRPLLERRDKIITLLARSDPAAGDQLSEMYVAYRKSMSNSSHSGD